MAYSKKAARFIRQLGMRFPMGQVEEAWREALDGRGGSQFGELEIFIAQSFSLEDVELGEQAKEVIAQLRQELDALKEKITSLAAYNSRYRTRVNAADTELSMLREDNEKLRERLGLLPDDVPPGTECS